jgi:hypothetical protein
VAPHPRDRRARHGAVLPDGRAARLVTVARARHRGAPRRLSDTVDEAVTGRPARRAHAA